LSTQIVIRLIYPQLPEELILMRKIQSGFTLIELMIVVAIIGILAAVAIPQYQNYVARTQMSEALSLASGSKVALAEYFQSKGVFPANNDEAGVGAATDIKGKYVTSVTVSDTPAAAAGGTVAVPTAAVDAQGILTVSLDEADTHTLLKGGSMILTGTDSGGSIIWRCSSTSTPLLTKYLPSSCQ
jgi:type IV pilus assembly protein PilA